MTDAIRNVKLLDELEDNIADYKAMKVKVDRLRDGLFYGVFGSRAELNTKVDCTQLEDGCYAYVTSNVSTEIALIANHTWTYVTHSQIMTEAEVKRLYESNGNTNVFDDTVKQQVADNTANLATLTGKVNTPNTDYTNTQIDGFIQGITKASLGLDQINNTSDANKPISSDTQTALDLKADISSTVTMATLNSRIAQETYVKSVVDSKIKAVKDPTNRSIQDLYTLASTKARKVNTYTKQEVNDMITASGGLGYTAENVAYKNKGDGYAGLDSLAKIRKVNLPISFYIERKARPLVGDTSVIYLDGERLYTWDGSVYTEISPTQLPHSIAADEHKILTIDDQGHPDWKSPVPGITTPDTTTKQDIVIFDNLTGKAIKGSGLKVSTRHNLAVEYILRRNNIIIDCTIKLGINKAIKLGNLSDTGLVSIQGIIDSGDRRISIDIAFTREGVEEIVGMVSSTSNHWDILLTPTFDVYLVSRDRDLQAILDISVTGSSVLNIDDDTTVEDVIPSANTSLHNYDGTDFMNLNQFRRKENRRSDAERTSLLNVAQSTGIISSAAGNITLPTTATEVIFITDKQATDSDIFTIDDGNNTITFKVKGKYSLDGIFEVTSIPVGGGDITVEVLDNADDSLISSKSVNINVIGRHYLTIRTYIQTPPKVVKYRIKGSVDGIVLGSFKADILTNAVNMKAKADKTWVMNQAKSKVDKTQLSIATTGTGAAKITGVATLDTTGKLELSQLPTINTANYVTKASLTEVYALDPADNNDIYQVSGKEYRWLGTGTSGAYTATDFKEMKAALDVATNDEVKAGTVQDKIVTPNNLKVALHSDEYRAQVSIQGLTKMVNDAESIDKTIDSKSMTPKGTFLAIDSMRATDFDATFGVDTEKFITPKQLGDAKLPATETVAGISAYATSTEGIAGTLSGKMISPKTLKAVIANKLPTPATDNQVLVSKDDGTYQLESKFITDLYSNNLNNIVKPGLYGSVDNITYTNMPNEVTTPFALHMYNVGTQAWQKIECAGRVFVRSNSSQNNTITWNGWQDDAGEGHNKVIWNADHYNWQTRSMVGTDKAVVDIDCSTATEANFLLANINGFFTSVIGVIATEGRTWTVNIRGYGDALKADGPIGSSKVYFCIKDDGRGHKGLCIQSEKAFDFHGIVQGTQVYTGKFSLNPRTSLGSKGWTSLSLPVSTINIYRMSTVDPDTLKTSGRYVGMETGGLTNNKPAGIGWCWQIDVETSNRYIEQIVRDLGYSRVYYTRYSTNHGTSWTTWEPHITPIKSKTDDSLTGDYFLEKPVWKHTFEGNLGDFAQINNVSNMLAIQGEIQRSGNDWFPISAVHTDSDHIYPIWRAGSVIKVWTGSVENNYANKACKLEILYTKR